MIIDAGKDVSICKGEKVQLNATGASTYTWSPSSSLNNPNIPDPVASPLTTVQYIVSTPFSTGNTTINGDFSAGNTGFSSNYQYIPDFGPKALWPEGTYTIGLNPGSYHENWGNYGDHTTGSGNYLICNGAGTPNVVVWEQQIKVCPNTTYNFSCWVLSLVTPPAILQFSINNVLIAPVFTTPNTIGVWEKYSATWYSGSNTTGVIRIINQNQTAAGNDFGLDDIFFESKGESRDTVTVTVFQPPVVNTNPITICAGDAGTLSAQGADTYTWSPAGGLSATSGSSVKAFPTATTTYSVTGTNNAGCTHTATVSVTVKPCGVAVTASGGSICINQCIPINATPNGGTVPYTYSWQPGNLPGPTQTVCPVESTTYTVTLTDGGGNTATATAAVQVNPAPPVIASATPVCSGVEATLTASGATAYFWSGGTNPSTGSTVTANPSTATTYTVLGTNIHRCTNTATARVSIEPLPVITASGGTLCSGSEVAVTLQAGGADTYSWSTGSQTPSIAVNPSTTTVYTVLGFSKAGCSGSASSTVMVYPLPKADFSTSPQPTNVFNARIYFKDLSDGNPMAWHWTFWDHLKDKPEKSILQNPPPYTYTDTGTYLVKLAIVNQYGCKDSINKYVVIGPEWSFYIPNTFTPNTDGKNDGFIGKSWNVTEHQMWIFDRWGNMVYTTGRTKDPESAIPWDGKANKGPDVAQIDTYVWLVVLKDIFGQKHRYVGHVNLIK